MPLLINPAGRIVDLDDEQFQVWSKKVGFQKPSPEEEKKYRKEKVAKVKALKLAKLRSQKGESVKGDNKYGIYMATVSQKGKDGYSNASRCIISELHKLHVDISTQYTNQNIALLFHNPFGVIRLESPVRIVYTMFESDKIPDSWVDYLKEAEKILVPSKWCQEVFAKSGIQSQVVPLGYDQETFKYKERKNKLKENQDFVFLHYNAFNIRKGFTEVFKAFQKAFRPDEPVKMIFKTTLDYPPLPITRKQYPNIEVITGKCENDELLDILYRSDCFVFPSRGEGFGMTPLEAMATGIPAIVPNAHGISEYFNSDYMYEVKVSDTCPGLYTRYKGVDVGKMVVCDVDHLVKQMRWVYDHQDHARKMGEKAAKYVKKWTYAKTAEKLKGIFDDITSRPIPKRPMRNVLRTKRI